MKVPVKQKIFLSDKEKKRGNRFEQDHYCGKSHIENESGTGPHFWKETSSIA